MGDSGNLLIMDRTGTLFVLSRGQVTDVSVLALMMEREDIQEVGAVISNIGDYVSLFGAESCDAISS